jgi:hypothetical protein
MVVRPFPPKPTIVVRAIGKRGVRAYSDAEMLAQLSLKQRKAGLTSQEEVNLFLTAGRILRARSKR